MSCMLISEREAVAFCIICASIYISCVSRVYRCFVTSRNTISCYKNIFKEHCYELVHRLRSDY